MIFARAWSLIRDNYSTYCDQITQAPERHFYRISAQGLASGLIATFVPRLSDDSISVLVTALSILIGFAFAAMFPIALESVAGLPKPIYAEDRDDIKIIRQLAVYFRFNVAYFIPLALTCVAALLIQMLDLTVPTFLYSTEVRLKKLLGEYWSYATFIRDFAPKIVLALSVLLLQECCYTFYRMCFNALALLRIKEEYIASRPESMG